MPVPKICVYLDYIPLALIVFYYTSYSEHQMQYKYIFYRFMTILLLWLLFYYMVYELNISREYTLLVCLILYFSSIQIRYLH
jgi:hypothetical protein